MSNDNIESISAKLRRWADESEEERPAHGYPSIVARTELGMVYGTPRDEERKLFHHIADEIDREMDELRELVNPGGQPIGEAVREIATGEDKYPWGDSKYPLLKKALDRYYLPRPLFEDGEPVQFGDTFVRDYGKDGTVSSLTYTKGNSDYVNVNGYKRHDFDHRLKRPKPQVLDADGVECHNGETVYQIDKVAGTSDNPLVIDKVTHDGTLWWKGGGCAPARLFTHRKPTVLDADSVPIEVGDTVYILPGEHCDKLPIKGFAAGDKCVVGNILNLNYGTKRGSILARSEKGVIGYPAPEQVTHREPDSQERIDDDAMKSSSEYWECVGCGCGDCPARIDGDSPDVRYGCNGNCTKAQMLDLLRRQRRLDGVEQ